MYKIILAYLDLIGRYFFSETQHPTIVMLSAESPHFSLICKKMAVMGNSCFLVVETLISICKYLI